MRNARALRRHGMAAAMRLGVLDPRSLWLFNIAMENGPVIDGLPIKNGDFNYAIIPLISLGKL